MTATLTINEPVDAMSPLGALVAHFNASSRSVKRSFAKMIAGVFAQEEQAKLQAKINAGIKDIREGKGVSREENETTAQFFERLCTE